MSKDNTKNSEVEYTIRPFENKDKNAVLDIFNYFVRESFAAFPAEEMGDEFINAVAKQAEGYAFYVAEVAGEVVGFGLLRPLYPFSNMKEGGEITYFILPYYTQLGIGTELLEFITKRAKELKMLTLVAKICSENKISITFHEKHGFNLCGRIAKVGNKFNQVFDIVIMQKFI